MEKIVNSLFHFGGLIRGFPPTISPALDDFEMMQYIQQPLKPAADNFRILISVNLFQPHEVEIHVLDKKVVEIRAKHGSRQSMEGLWMTRNCTYTYELPPEVRGKELHAEWSEDHYLLIQATSSKCDEDCDKVKLVPEHVQNVLKPVVEMGTVKEMIEDIRDRSHQVLRYIRFHTQNVPVEVAKQDEDIGHEEESKKSSGDDSHSDPTDESISTDDMRTYSSEKDSSK